MKSTLILALSCSLLSLSASSQIMLTWSPDSMYQKEYQIFLQKINIAEIKKDDLQIRLWFSNDGTRINVVTLIIITNENKIWTSTSYIFSKEDLRDSITMNQKETANLNLDSLYKQLLKDSLLTLSSRRLSVRSADSLGNDVVWTDAGPTIFFVEIVSHKGYKSLSYPCPKLFFEQNKLPEFKSPLKIITALLYLIGSSPC